MPHVLAFEENACPPGARTAPEFNIPKRGLRKRLYFKGRNLIDC